MTLARASAQGCRENGLMKRLGLYGYVLADSYHRWPLTSPVSGELTAEVNKSQWRSAAQK